MATRSGRPMLNDDDPHYTTRTMHMTTRARDLHDKMERWHQEHGATATARQRAARLIAACAYDAFYIERNWDARQIKLQKALAALVEFETLVGV